MPRLYADTPDQSYVLPIDQIKADLEQLKHGYFTDPKDQSPWNYHDWLISLVSPIQVVAMGYVPQVQPESDKCAIMIGLSHKVRNMKDLAISLVDEVGNPIEFEIQAGGSNPRRSIASTWMLLIAKDIFESQKILSFSIQVPNLNGKNLSQIQTAETTDGHRLFRNFFTHLKVEKEADKVKVTYELGDTVVWDNSN